MAKEEEGLVPNLTQPLVDYLDSLYPEHCADSSSPDREIWIKVGERKVIRFLIEQFNRQLTG